MIKNFFSELSKRLNSENDLSDITWALLRSSLDFRNAFLSFLEITDLESPIEFEREYLLRGNLRVDLAIISGLVEVLLENKIWDTNYHFDEYSKGVPSSNKTRLVLLSAHQIDHSDEKLAYEKGWNIKYWHDFEERLSSITFKEFDDVRTGFISYLRRVCMIRPINKIHFDSKSLISLYSFNNLICRIVQNASHEGFIYALYPCPRSFSEEYSGTYYSITKKGEAPFTYPAIGISYEEEPVISIWLDRDWNKIVNNLLKITPQKTAWFEVETESDYLAFNLLPNLFDKFNRGEKAEQFSLLQDFFKNTNQFIEKAIEDFRSKTSMVR